MILFSHPTGNANVRHAALALERGGLLGEFWTTINFAPPALLRRAVPVKWRKQLERRGYPADLTAKLHSHPWREAIRHLEGRLGVGVLSRHETGPCSVDGVYQSLDRRVAQRLRRPAFTGVYAYEDGAETSFRVARELGKKTIYDQPIGYWRAARRLLEEEAGLQPEWASTLSGNRDSERKNARKDAELSLADIVVVASSFTKRTLEASGRALEVAVIPYGAPIASVAHAPRLRKKGEPLRALFVGSLGQRKGLSYLFDAQRQLGAGVELTVIGRRPPASCPALERELARVRYIETCPHREILEEMSRHDVFIFPSLFEGFGLVLLEAMAMGLPIVATPHTAAPDLITDGAEGFIVPIRSSEAIVSRLETLRASPEQCTEMGRRATLRAQTFTWQHYEEELATVVRQAFAA
ncbi:MAG: glycosyltransferase family 4 protein [Verrucomicrobiota bacterium]